MSALINAPHFRTDNIDGIMQRWQAFNPRFLFSPMIPVNQYDKDRIEMEIVMQDFGGMTPLSSIGAMADAIRTSNRRSKVESEIPVWKEKVGTSHIEIYDRRKVGTYDALTALDELHAAKERKLMYRLAVRKEQMIRDVIFYNRVVGQLKTAGQSVQWDYLNHSPDFEVQAQVSWDDNANARVVEDIANWTNHYRKHSDYTPSKLLLPNSTWMKLRTHDFFQQFAVNNYQAFSGNNPSVAAFIRDYIGDLEIVESYDRLPSVTYITATVSAGASTITVQNPYDWAAGDQARLVRISDGANEIVEIASVSGRVLTLTGVTTLAYAIGDDVHVNKYTVPEGLGVILGTNPEAPFDLGLEAQPDGELRENWLEIVSTRALDSITSAQRDPKPGLFMQTIDELDKETKMLWTLMGINMLPRLNVGNAHMVCELFY
jgi:hypothetical protein